MNVLEGLYAARASISPGAFEFVGWHTCTCGHIYGAANGGLAREDKVVRFAPAEGLYGEMLAAVVEANGLPLVDLRGGLFQAGIPQLAATVSEATSALADKQPGDPDEARRNAAVLLISTAIEKLEGEQQRAMLDVKARAEAAGGPVGELAGLGAGR